MSEKVTWEQFHATFPQYFERADKAATHIFDRAIANPASRIEVQATVFDRNSPEYRKQLSDPEQLAEVWQTEQWETLDADVPLDNMRLGLEVTKAIQKQIRAWLYAVPTPILSDSVEGRTQIDLETPSDKAKTDWISSAARKHLGNLAMPGYLFFGAEGYVDKRPRILAYVYSTYDAKEGQHEYNGASGVGGIREEALADALAPPLTQQDIRRIEQSSETFHAAKIERLLQIVEAIAERGA